MGRSADIIIGGGISGLTTALRLREQGADRVTLIERHFVGSGQSHRAAGIVRATVRDVCVARALVDSIEHLTTFEEQYGERIVFHRTGYLLLVDPDERAVVEKMITIAGRAGCETGLVSHTDAMELQPGLREDEETLYVYEPGAIHVDPMPTLQAVRRAAEERGVAIVEDCEVTDILVDHDRVVGVETARGRMEAPQVLVATSVWGRDQLLRLGIDVPVYPHRAEMGFFHVPPDDSFQLQRIVSDARSMLYLRPEGRDQMFVGWREGDRVRGTDDMVTEDPDQYRQTSHYPSMKSMQDGLAVTLPPMAGGFVHRTYACVYDYTPDGMPILDQTEGVEGLYFALGFSGGGFSLSPWVGRTMARFMATGAKPDEIVRFDGARFSENRLIDWSNASAGEG